MTLWVLGLNHQTAPVELRERAAFAGEALPRALGSLRDTPQIAEAVLLSTCNRTELYAVADSAQALDQWLHTQAGDLQGYLYQHADAEAVRHLFRVATGLDSMVLGEPQILGQMKSAYAVAREAGSVGPLLGRLFQATFSTAKTVRTDTAIGENPVSVAFAAVSLAKQIFANLDRSQALLIGAGETITLVARHLHEQGVKKIVVANREKHDAVTVLHSIEHLERLADDAPDKIVAQLKRIVPEYASPDPARAATLRFEQDVRAAAGNVTANRPAA